jgi:hypothetical protein
LDDVMKWNDLSKIIMKGAFEKVTERGNRIDVESSRLNAFASIRF